MFRFSTPLCILLTLVGCTTTSTGPMTGEKSMQDRFGNAVVSPLSDLNIVQTAIPEVAENAKKNPYQMPSDTSCAALVEEVKKLDAALGADLDVIAAHNEKSYAEQGQEFIENEAVGTVQRTISGFIPFRGWVRKITGAERHDREVASCISAATVRRAFLKGLGAAHGCEPPASPVKHMVPNVPIDVPATIPVSDPAPVRVTPPATLPVTSPAPATPPGTATQATSVPMPEAALSNGTTTASRSNQ